MNILIILGAHVNKVVPTKALKERLDKAIEFLNVNKDSLVIVSGGQGENEITSEAEVMKKYLLKANINENRIFVENKARNTIENISYSNKIIKDKNLICTKIYIVTNWYHGPRSILIGKSILNKNVKLLPSRYLSWKLLKYIPREILAYLKDFYILKIHPRKQKQ